MLLMGVYDQERDNMVQWDNKLWPFYEVYFLKVNFANTSKALGLRYSLLSPKKALGPPSASLAAMYYDYEDSKKNVAVKETVAIEQTTIDRDIFYFQILENAIYNSGARGKVASGGHELSWDLQFTHNEESFRLYPHSFYLLPFPKTKWISPNESIQISGELKVDGQLFSLQDNSGYQAHLWGNHHSERWAWGHCNTFEEDSSAVVEALTIPMKISKKFSRPLTLFALRLGNGLELKFNHMNNWIFNKSHYSIEGWEFSGERGQWRVKASVVSPRNQLFGANDTDTDGTKLYYYHTEMADFKIELFQRKSNQYQLFQTLHSSHAGSFEIAERTPFPELTLHI